MLINKFSLISTKIDFILIGGFALITYIIIYFTGFNISADVAVIMFYLAFFVNSPHFMISYEIFYSEGFKKIMSSQKFFFAGIIVPVFLLCIIWIGFISQSKIPFLFMLISMFFLVGWHYIKQTYGCFIVYSAGNKIYYNKLEQSIIKFSLYPLWVFSFLKLFTSDHMKDYWGLEYNFSGVLVKYDKIIAYSSLLGFLLFLIIIFYGFFIKKIKPNLIALTPMIIVYIWMSPLFWNEIYFYMIPFFHSLQYFLFSGAYTKNKIERDSSGFKGWLIWWGGAFILGSLFFEILPKYFDSIFYVGNAITPNLFLISFIFFINIHHYFIDSVIWRGDNIEVRENLKFKLNF